MMMKNAMIMVARRSILARCFVSLWWPASFSLIITRSPVMESMKLWTASDVMARDPETNPMMMLKIPKIKLIAINKYPAFVIVRPRLLFWAFGAVFGFILRQFYHILV